jgi:hypothetical protein
MANRFFNQFRYALEKKGVDIFLTSAIGGSGATTISAVNSKGVVSFGKITTGMYLVKLMDSFRRLLSAKATFVGPYIPASPHMFVPVDGCAYQGGIGTAVFVSVQAGQTITINGVVFTGDNTAAGAHQFITGVSDTAMLATATTGLVARINAATDAALTGNVVATNIANTLFLKFLKLPATYTKSDTTITLYPAAAPTNAPSMVVEFTAAGTATEPASGEEVRIDFLFSDSTAL